MKVMKNIPRLIMFAVLTLIAVFIVYLILLKARKKFYLQP